MKPASFNLADVWEGVAAQVPGRVAIVCGERRLTYAQLDERANRLAHWMRAQGVGPGQHVGCYLRNGPEYVEAMLAAYKLRAAPININYRYVDDELAYLFADADLVGVVHHRSFSPRIVSVRDRLANKLSRLHWCLTVDDDSGAAPAAGPDYEAALAGADPVGNFPPRSGDDPYVIYTGGTTGMPKGVVWRSEDAFFACMGGGDATRVQGPVRSPDEVLSRISKPADQMVFLPAAPLMHAAGCWTVMMWLFAGARIVLLPGPFEPQEIWRTVEREHVRFISVVGDAMLRPLLDGWDALDPKPDISCLASIGSGGAPMSVTIRQRTLATVPGVRVADGYGSSETGIQGARRFDAGTSGQPGSNFSPSNFSPSNFSSSNATVLDEVSLTPLSPGDGRVGRVARTGRIPLGYYNDPEKTARTFVERDGQRWAISGDMGTLEADGTITVLGRGSLCINTGGEKVFPDEVEAVLRAHPAVYDAVVVGAPDKRWGQRVVAIVQTTNEITKVDAAELRGFCRASLAGYKVPKDVVFVDEIVRSPAGKADYRWAARVASRS